MGGRVYDPIHDVFQETSTDEQSRHEGKTDVTSQHLPTSTTITIDDDDDDDGDEDDDNNNSINKNVTQDVELDDDGDSTQSEDNSMLKQNNTTLITSIPSTNGNLTQKENTPIISPIRYNRHLKKPDGDYFSRKDLQFNFLETLLNDKREVFTNIFKDFYLNSLISLSDSKNKKKSPSHSSSFSSVLLQPPSDLASTNNVINITDPNYDARRFINHDKLTFSQLYVLCLATSNKSSKILRDKLLLDSQVAFSTCLLSILVNIGRLNTTINFYLAMTSQLRTFHSVPALQYNIADPKSLQDTPRLKSILKSLSIGNDPIILSDLYQKNEKKKNDFNIINLLFAICDNISLINLKFLNKKFLQWNQKDDGEESISLFSILDQSRFKTGDRVTFLIWLLYIHLETDLSDEEIQESLKTFGTLVGDEWKIELHDNDKGSDEEDVDLDYEIDFGLAQKNKRKEFLDFVQSKKIKEAKKKVENLDYAYKDVSDKGKIKIELLTSPNPSNSNEEIKEKELSNLDMPNHMASILNPIEDAKKRDASLLDEENFLRQDIKQSNDGESNNDNDHNNMHNNNRVENIDGDVKINKKRRKRRTKAEMLTAKRLEVDNLASKNSDISTENGDSEISLADSPISVLQTPQKEQGIQNIAEFKSTAAKLNEERVSNLIQLDASKKVTGIDKTQEEFVTDLLKAHEIIRKKRNEVGLIKIFNEYEDVTMASVIGIRGKKRKKYKDELLGFETDYLRDFVIAKRTMLKRIMKQPKPEDIEENFFKL